MSEKSESVIAPTESQAPAGALGLGTGSGPALNDPLVLEAVAGIHRRTWELTLKISSEIRASGYGLTPVMERYIEALIAEHVMVNEWREGVKFHYATSQNAGDVARAGNGAAPKQKN